MMMPLSHSAHAAASRDRGRIAAALREALAFLRAP